MLSTRATAAGFGLAEMMVALALGLLVAAAALAFVLGLVRANAETVLSTRLHQELRATMMLVAGELRRAGGVDDSIAGVGQGQDAGAIASVEVSGPACARYLHGGVGDASRFRALRIDGGKLALVRAANAASGGCDAVGTPLNTDAVEITHVTFLQPAGNARRIDIAVTGRLRCPPAYLRADALATTRTLRESIAIRSNAP